ncbi:hypothetical protein PG999_014687 [Apiospora kogelbergensis]|uniref:Uncharacterized protein n=1 Tax=Apiospora kogelbergensis TaxID=1337665 RepID=A0AAW0Q2L9_9PEZI
MHSNTLHNLKTERFGPCNQCNSAVRPSLIPLQSLFPSTVFPPPAIRSFGVAQCRPSSPGKPGKAKANPRPREWQARKQAQQAQQPKQPKQPKQPAGEQAFLASITAVVTGSPVSIPIPIHAHSHDLANHNSQQRALSFHGCESSGNQSVHQAFKAINQPLLSSP